MTEPPPTLPRLGRRVTFRSAAGALLANLDGALFTFIFLVYIAPQETIAGGTGSANDLRLFFGYFVIASAVVGKVIEVMVRKTSRWVSEDRTPSDAERMATLALP